MNHFTFTRVFSLYSSKKQAFDFTARMERWPNWAVGSITGRGRSDPRVTIPVSVGGSLGRNRRNSSCKYSFVGVTGRERQQKFDFASRNLRCAEVFRRNVTTTKRGNHACHLGNGTAVLTRRPINGRLYGDGNLWDESRFE